MSKTNGKANGQQAGKPVLTTRQGHPVHNNQDMRTVGNRGPAFLGIGLGDHGVVGVGVHHQADVLEELVAHSVQRDARPAPHAPGRRDLVARDAGFDDRIDGRSPSARERALGRKQRVDVLTLLFQLGA